MTKRNTKHKRQQQKPSFPFRFYVFCKGPWLDVVHVVCNYHKAMWQPNNMKVKYIYTYFIFTLPGKKGYLHLGIALLLQWGFSQSINYAKSFPQESVWNSKHIEIILFSCFLCPKSFLKWRWSIHLQRLIVHSVTMVQAFYCWCGVFFPVFFFLVFVCFYFIFNPPLLFLCWLPFVFHSKLW